MGDVVGLVERAAETIQVEEAEKLAAKMAKGKFDLDELSPDAPDAAYGRRWRAGQHDARYEGHEGRDGRGIDDKALVHMEAMLSSMTAREQAKPEVINAKRKIRVAKGSGTMASSPILNPRGSLMPAVSDHVHLRGVRPLVRMSIGVPVVLKSDSFRLPRSAPAHG